MESYILAFIPNATYPEKKFIIVQKKDVFREICGELKKNSTILLEKMDGVQVMLVVCISEDRSYLTKNYDELTSNYLKETHEGDLPGSTSKECCNIAMKECPYIKKLRQVKLDLEKRLNQTPKPKLDACSIRFVDGNAEFGPNGSRIPEEQFKKIKWNSPEIATRQLLSYFFTRKQLATHTLTSKASNAHRGRQRDVKKQLDPKIIEDILNLVSFKSQIEKSDVKHFITTKCADESRLYKKQNGD